jgi:type I restriction enzyme S subunit
MNETLEAIARALFKSWFVDFDPVRAKMAGEKPAGLEGDLAALFPDCLVDSPLGMIPDGWEVKEISDCCNQVMNGSTPSRKEPLYWENGNIPWLTSGEVRQTIILEPDNRITQLAFKKSSVKLVPAFSTVVALYGATAGQVSLIASEMTTNQAICALVPKEFFSFYTYLNISTQVRYLEQQARGSAQQNLSKGIVEKTRIIVPKNEILHGFQGIVSPLFMRWIENLRENQTLSELRDTLLPKLISGKLRVNDINDIKSIMEETT